MGVPTAHNQGQACQYCPELLVGCVLHTIHPGVVVIFPWMLRMASRCGSNISMGVDVICMAWYSGRHTACTCIWCGRHTLV